MITSPDQLKVKVRNFISVPDLIQQLFRWLKESKFHPLVKSCIFHYEFEFVEFMLGMICDALQEISKAQNEHDVVINVVKNVVTNEDKVISLLRQDNRLSANMLANSLGITQRQAQRILSKLKEEGKLLRHGANKNGYWEVID